MKKLIFTMAILSVMFTACGVGGNTETPTADSTAVKVDSTCVDTACVDTTKVDTLK
jgi:hypothetical protein